MADLTEKQIKLLNALGRGQVIAGWAHDGLSKLERLGYAVSSAAFSASGRLSSSKLWAISVKGREFLDTELLAKEVAAKPREPMW